MVSSKSAHYMMEPDRRLSFEKRRLALRLLLLAGPAFLILTYGERVLQLSILTSLIVIGSSLIILWICIKHKEVALKWQLLFRAIDVGLIFLVLYHVAIILGEPQYSFLYIISVVSAVATHGRTGLFMIAGIASVAVFLERFMHYQTGLAVFGFGEIADASFISFMFFVTGAYVNLLVSQRAEAVRAVHLQRDRFQALVRSSSTINANLGLRQVLDAVCRITARVLNIDIVTISLLDRDESMLRISATYGLGEKEINELNPVKIEDLKQFVSSVSDTIYVENIQDLENLPNAQFYKSIDLQSTLATSLINGDEMLGRLNVGSLHHVRQFSPEEKRLLKGLANQAALAIRNASIFDEVRQSKIDLERTYDETLKGWVHALDLRDNETQGHTQRVTELTCKLARKFGFGDEELIHVRRGALLHDIGKIGIPDRILKKPGSLDEDEWKLMKQHPVYAFEMLKSIDYLRPAIDIPYYHHERWDGSGYPLGLKGEKIPLIARIFAVVDVWDALRSDRPYRPAMSEEKVIEYIKEQSGKQFDPAVVKAFLQTMKERPLTTQDQKTKRT